MRNLHVSFLAYQLQNNKKMSAYIFSTAYGTVKVSYFWEKKLHNNISEAGIYDQVR